MKELSIEEKAKLYDDAKARMSRAFNTNRCTIGFMNEIFPEFKESNDERIIEAIIQFFESQDDNTTYCLVPKKDILTWLKKQKEKSIWTDNDRIMAFTLLRDVDQMTYISKEGKDERLQWLNSLEDKFNNRE